MTTLAEPPVEPALDVRTFLLGDEGPAALRERLREAVDRDSADRPEVTRALRRVADEQLAEVAAGFLDIDLGATAVGGWRLHGQLRDAARETAATPGLTTIVELAEHRMTSTWRPRIDIVLGPTTLAHLAFELAVTFDIVGLHASVTAGRLTRLGGGRGQLEAVFSFGGQRLVERRAPFDAHLSVRLGPGVPLLGVPEPRAAPSVVEAAVEETHAPR